MSECVRKIVLETNLLYKLSCNKKYQIIIYYKQEKRKITSYRRYPLTMNNQAPTTEGLVLGILKESYQFFYKNNKLHIVTINLYMIYYKYF